MTGRILVICIDRDNDLFEKAGVSGPLIGRQNNLEGATALALADPEDPDSNAIFCAIKTYDDLRKDNLEVEVVTLTGDKRLGFKADRSISSQLERITLQLNPVSCVFISDGASDEEMLPIIKSRLKVDSTKIVFIKQAKELEKTYFVLLEKLRDPYFAKIIIGIPALIILLFSLSSIFGFGWQPIGILIGLYLLLRTFGIDELLLDIVKDFKFSLERTSWVGYLGAMAIFTICIFIGYQAFLTAVSMHLSDDKIIFSVIESTVWIFYIGIIMIMAGKIIDAIMANRKYEVPKYLLYSAAGLLTTLILFVASAWIVNLYQPYVDFGMFLEMLVISLILGYASTILVNWYRKEILAGLKLEGKEAISEHGSYLGKIVGFDIKKDIILIQNVFDKKFSVPISAVRSVEEKVVLKAGD